MRARNPIIASITLSLLLLTPARGDDPATLFHKANAAYEDGDYENARTAYLSIVENHGIAPDLFFNLGNAAYRLNEPGEAVLWFQRALVLQPNHPESRQNLRFLENQLGYLNPEWNFLQRFADTLSRRQLICLALGGFWTVTLALAIPFALNRRSLRAVLTGFRVAGLVALAFAVTALLVRKNDNLLLSRAIVTADKTIARASPADDSKDVILLPPGTQVDHLAQRAAWSYVSVPGDTRGWVRTSELAPLWPFDSSFLE